MIVVIVIYRLVCFLPDITVNRRKACLLITLLFATFHAIAVDSISINIGKLSVDSYELTNLEILTKIPDTNDQLSVQASARFLHHPVVIDAILGNNAWKATSYLKLTADQIAEIYQQVSASRPGWKLSGQYEFNLRASGALQGNTQPRLNINVVAEHVGGEFKNIPLAMEDVAFSARADLTGSQQSLRGSVAFNLKQGLIAAGDLLLEPLAGPISFSSGIHYRSGILELTGSILNDPGGLLVNIPKAKIDLENIGQHEAHIVIKSARFPHTYTAWLQPLLYDSVFGELETDGELSAEIKIKNNQITDLGFNLRNISLADKAQRFSIYGMNSQYHGENSLADGELSVDYQGAEIYRLLLGGSSLNFSIRNSRLSLLDQAAIPVYEGELKIFNLAFDNINTDDLSVEFDGVLTPISLSSLTHALGWQNFSGTISGVIPGVRYQNKILSVDGILLARAFDGVFRIKGLTIENFMGSIPGLTADFSVDNINLEKLTSTYDFGRMEGRLSGYVRNLQMLAWQPASFDAFFYTPEDDESRHIISQRAVDNLTSLSGSDIGSVLSRTYLRFLDNFRYDRLGIGCKLKNNICQMRGVLPASGSAYYIVKAGFLPPRLDIIGYSHEVDWDELVKRIKRVVSDNAPVIQ